MYVYASHICYYQRALCSPSITWISYYALVKDLIAARCWWRSWLRHCATRRRVAGSISDGIIGIFHWQNPSAHTMALGLTRLTQSLTEMSTRNICWGKGGLCVGLTTLPPSCTDWLEIWEPQGLSGPVMGLLFTKFNCNRFTKKFLSPVHVDLCSFL